MTDPLTLEEYYDQRLAGAVAVSPDGDRVAFLVTEFDPAEEEARTSLFVAPTDGDAEPHRLTRASDAASPGWSPDGSRLAFLATRPTDVALAVERTPDDEGPDDDDEETQVWAFDLERGGDARQLTSFDEGVRDFDWGPDGERLVVAARDPTEEEAEELQRRRDGGPVVTERLQHVADGEAYLDTVSTHLFVVDPVAGSETRLDVAVEESAMLAAWGLGPLPRWGPGGEIAYVGTVADEPDDTYVVDVFAADPESGDAERVTDGDLTAVHPRWSPDGRTLAFVGYDPVNRAIPPELSVASRDDGTTRSLSAGLDRPVHHAAWLDGDRLVGTVGDEGQTTLYEFGLDGSLRRVFADQDAYTGLRSFDANGPGGVLGLTLDSPNDREVYALSLADEPAHDGPVRLTSFTRDSAVEIECRRTRFSNGDGDEVEGIVYAPPGYDFDDPEPSPAILKIHGGPASYDQPRYDFEHRYWASNGYLVCNVNYRGSRSYGRAFCESIRGDWGPRETDDLESAIDHLIDQRWVDPDRVFATGFSQGGVNTVYLAARTDRLAAAAAEHGVYDYGASFGVDDCHVWWENDFGLPWENRQRYRASSPLAGVDRIETPTLLTAGGEDRRCPPSQTEQLYVSLKKRGVPARLVVYPDENHSKGGPDVHTHRIEEITGWFERHDPATGDD